TMWMHWSFMVFSGDLLTDRTRRQHEAKYGTTSRVVREFEMAVVILDDGAADVQAHAHAFGLGGVKRRKQALAFVFRDAWAVIGNRHLDRMRIERARTHFDDALAR